MKPESVVPGKPSHLSVQTSQQNSELLINWKAPNNVRVVLVRGYILGYGLGTPDQYKVVLEASERKSVIKNTSEQLV